MDNAIIQFVLAILIVLFFIYFISFFPKMFIFQKDEEKMDFPFKMELKCQHCNRSFWLYTFWNYGEYNDFRSIIEKSINENNKTCMKCGKLNDERYITLRSNWREIKK